MLTPPPAAADRRQSREAICQSSVWPGRAAVKIDRIRTREGTPLPPDVGRPPRSAVLRRIQGCAATPASHRSLQQFGSQPRQSGLHHRSRRCQGRPRSGIVEHMSGKNGDHFGGQRPIRSRKRARPMRGQILPLYTAIPRAFQSHPLTSPACRPCSAGHKVTTAALSHAAGGSARCPDRSQPYQVFSTLNSSPNSLVEVAAFPPSLLRPHVKKRWIFDPEDDPARRASGANLL